MRSLRLLAVLIVFSSAFFGGAVGSADAAPPILRDVSVTPQVRVLDTRLGIGAPAGLVAPGRTIVLAVPSAAAAGASSVILNLTSTGAVAPGFATVWPCGEAMPLASALNFVPGRNSANAVLTKLPPGGICIATSVAVHLIADVGGWYTGTADFTGSVPYRLLDTRTPPNALQPYQERRLKVAGTPGISGVANIAALNFTVTRTTDNGYISAYPCGQKTDGSTVNFSAGETVAGLSMVALGGGDVCFFSSVVTDIVVDSYGWSNGSGRLKVQTPQRVLDTRSPAIWPFGIAQSDSTLYLRVAGRGGVPNDADAALLTVTVANATTDGFVTVWPCDQPFPTASTINTWPNALRSNLATVKLSQTDGMACLRYYGNSGTPTNLIVDAIGWTTGGPARSAPTGPGKVDGSYVGLPCGLASPVLCETFDAPAGGGTRTGDLNPVLWGVSRLGNINPSQNMLNDVPVVSMTGCGTTAWVTTPNDVRICNGQLFETVNDGGGVTNLDMYPKQPFDFAGRTGKVTFDVSADSDGSHGAWPEFLITDKPVPGARGTISGGIPSAAVNEIGFTLDGCTSGPGGTTGVGRIYMTKNGVYSEPNFTGVSCVTKGSAKAMNHFEVRINQNRLEVWGTDAGSTNLKQLAVADNLGLTLTKGLVWMNDVHYNARKAIEPCECGTQWNHTFVWDNLGFDGPKTYRDLAFDVPDANIPGANTPFQGDATRRTGFNIGNGPVTLTTASVRRDQTPTAALVVLNTYSFGTTVPSVSVNGNPYINTAWPPYFETYGWFSLAIPIPLDQVKDGPNTLTFKSGDGSTTIANISIILVAASPVP